MADDTPETRPSQDESRKTLQVSHTPAQTGSAVRGAVCGCGAAATGVECDTAGLCPLGAPWVCHRQMQLPFEAH